MAHLTGFEPVAYRLGGGRSILLSYRCLPLPLHYSRRARGLSRKRTGMRARREKADARENECGTGVKMRRTGKRRCRAAANPCCGEKRTLSRTGAEHFPLLRRLRRAKNAPRTENRTERRPPLEAFPGAEQSGGRGGAHTGAAAGGQSGPSKARGAGAKPAPRSR